MPVTLDRIGRNRRWVYGWMHDIYDIIVTGCETFVVTRTRKCSGIQSLAVVQIIQKTCIKGGTLMLRLFFPFLTADSPTL